MCKRDNTYKRLNFNEASLETFVTILGKLKSIVLSILLISILPLIRAQAPGELNNPLEIPLRDKDLLFVS